MSNKNVKIRIALVGGGPSCLFLLKRLIDLKQQFDITIFEREAEIGAGMPYSEQGANKEHITNVSDNEIPTIQTSVKEWIETVSPSLLDKFGIDPDLFTKFHVLPRLLFGKYLNAQFKLLAEEARKNGISLHTLTKTTVVDVIDFVETKKVQVITDREESHSFDAVVLCTGHNWPKKQEGKIPGYFDSPYPPSKLAIHSNHKVAIKGSSLTAIDAIRTLARKNGRFIQNEVGKLIFEAAEDSPNFKIVMHSRNGLLPAIRFHLDEPQLSNDSLLTEEEIEQNKADNGGFLSLDYLFEKNYKENFKRKDPAFYKKIKDMNLEKFVDMMMKIRQGKDAFQLFRQEYLEAEKSIEKRESIYWKEMLAELSYTMNYPAKYLSAEDMLRLKSVLSPLIAIVIAFVPQNSCDELFALHDAGRLELLSVGSDSEVKPKKEGGIVYHYTDESGKKHAINFETYIDCSGQPHLSYEDLPFESLRNRKCVSQAVLRFKSAAEAVKLVKEGSELVVQNSNGDYFLQVAGITISDHFQIVNEYGIPNERVYIMAVPYIGGYNPDYSGLDFCEEASSSIIEKISELHDHQKIGSVLS